MTNHTIDPASITVPASKPAKPFAVAYVRPEKPGATGIVVPALCATDDPAPAALRKLHAKLKGMGIPYNDLILSLIDACIETGLDNRKQIKDALGALGFKAGSVISRLNYETGTGHHHRYRVDADGHYSLA